MRARPASARARHPQGGARTQRRRRAPCPWSAPRRARDWQQALLEARPIALLTWLAPRLPPKTRSIVASSGWRTPRGQPREIAEDAPAHGVAREHNGVIVVDVALEGRARLWQRHAHVACVGCKRLVGKTRHRVLLVEHVGDVLLAAAVHEGKLDVGAKPHGNVRRALLGKDLPHARGCLALAHKGRDERPGAASGRSRSRGWAPARSQPAGRACPRAWRSGQRSTRGARGTRAPRPARAPG